MRPEILFQLFSTVDGLSGVGARTQKQIEKACGGNRILDLAWHFPENVIDRRRHPKIAAAVPQEVVTLAVRVEKHINPPNKRAPYRVRCSDDSGTISLVFFRPRPDYLKRLLPEGEMRWVSGRIEAFSGNLQISHPDHIVEEKDKASIMIVEPVYGLTAGLSNKVLNKAMAQVLERIPELPEWNDSALIVKQGWQSWKQSILSNHKPTDSADIEDNTTAKQRLAYDELLANQLALAVVRESTRKRSGLARKGNGSLQKTLINALPYSLTNSQRSAVSDIHHDLETPARMLRLLQGDVGSGKTIVALLSMLSVVETGAQAALMAPTEILARQHYETISGIIERADLGVSVVVLTGREKGKNRASVIKAIQQGDAQIIVGTHALFQADVIYRDLGLAVIDEQHRFGVQQRLELAAKGRAVDVLVMTATPIPRTLTLTVYGDMDVTKLTEKPAGRRPIKTRAITLSRMTEVLDGLKRSLSNGDRIYWICPLVEESEKIDVAAAEDRARFLEHALGCTVGLVHGRMSGKDKTAVMQRFSSGELSILVGTTVVEVGVDVPEASIMIIDHAERFGLSQLHQLRGRVGRGERLSSCVLLYEPGASQTAKERIRIMRDSDDGFEIAEKDLELRGAGELLGTRQSGLPEFRVADLSLHADLLATARKDAQLIMRTDPGLKTERGQNLRVLLYLFERDGAIRNLHSG